MPGLLRSIVAATSLQLTLTCGQAGATSFTVTSGLFEVQGQISPSSQGMGVINGPSTYPSFPYVISSPLVDQRPLIVEDYSFSINDLGVSSYCIDNALSDSPCGHANGRTQLPIRWSLSESNRLLSVSTTPNASGTIFLPSGLSLVAVPGPIAGSGLFALVGLGVAWFACRRRALPPRGPASALETPLGGLFR